MATKTSVETFKQTKLLNILKQRFEANPKRHKSIAWSVVEKKLKRGGKKLRTLSWMEETGGEPDVVGLDKKTDEILFYDCAAESPVGRRSLCYDDAARKARKEATPKGSAVALAKKMGAALLSEGEYRALQKLGVFDVKTSSWVATPEPIRKLGGALFCDRRYDTVFTYHNGAESYYAARGFRCVVRV